MTREGGGGGKGSESTMTREGGRGEGRVQRAP